MEGLVMIDRTFWKGKRVFLTGHTGFKGSWLAEWLILLGAAVRGYSLPPPTKPSLFEALALADRLDHVKGDIRDPQHLQTALAEFRPDVVFHLAAQPLVRLSYAEPRMTYETNVMGTLNVYEAVRACPDVRVVVSITTDKCYENREWVWGYREDDPMGGYDPYSSSKGCAELLTAAYRSSYFNPSKFGKGHQVALATTRAGNVIGGGDWAADRLLPDCVRALGRKETISIRSPRATRPWQHVLEPLSGYLCLAEALWGDGIRYGGGWNFGPSDEGVVAVEDVVKAVVEAWGEGAYRVEADADLHEAQLLKLDISKARSFLKWKPRLKFADAIEMTVAIYRLFGTDLSGIPEAVRSQIESYMAPNHQRGNA